jgi:hypothetical protein
MPEPVPEEKSHLEELEESVNSREEHAPYDRARFLESKNDVPLSWQGRRIPPGQSKLTIVPPSGYSPFLLKFLALAAVFFVLAAGVAFYRFFIATSTISPAKIEITLKGAPSARGGEAFPLEIEVHNGNPVDLLGAVLVLDYPEGVQVAGSVGQTNRYSKELGTISANGQGLDTVQLTVFGKENTDQVITAHLEYRTAESLQVFKSKEITYSVTVSSAPVTITTKIPPELNVGEEFTFEIHLTANTGTSIKNALISLEYPDSFTYVNATPSPSYATSMWRIADLAPGKEQVIQVRGKMTGEVDSEKTLRVRVGLEDPNKPREIGTLYTSTSETFSVKRSFVGLSLSVSGDEKSNFTVVKSGDLVSVDLSWVNNLDTKIQDAQFEVRVNGAIVDRASIVPNLGEYRSADNVILWNQRTDRTFASVDPDQKGSIHFVFSTKSLFASDGASYRKPEFSIDVVFKGNRISEGFDNKTISVTATRKVRVSSAITLGVDAGYYKGPFANSGPLPPHAEKETTYTIFWNISNSSNDVRDAVVTAKLPPYLHWLGKTNPASGITYNEATGEVRWNVGDLPAGTGFTKSAKTASFQISFTPSLSQIGATPPLISETQFSGIDTFVDSRLSGTRPSVTISQVSDLRAEDLGEIKP